MGRGKGEMYRVRWIHTRTNTLTYTRRKEVNKVKKMEIKQNKKKIEVEQIINNLKDMLLKKLSKHFIIFTIHH